MGAWRGGETPSPTLDGLAARGVRFERAYSQCSWTAPSMVSMVTGRYVAAERLRVPPELPTVAELFRDAGWGTGAFVFQRADLRGQRLHARVRSLRARPPLPEQRAGGELAARAGGRAHLHLRPPGRAPRPLRAGSRVHRRLRPLAEGAARALRGAPQLLRAAGGGPRARGPGGEHGLHPGRDRGLRRRHPLRGRARARLPARAGGERPDRPHGAPDHVGPRRGPVDAAGLRDRTEGPDAPRRGAREPRERAQDGPRQPGQHRAGARAHDPGRARRGARDRRRRGGERGRPRRPCSSSRASRRPASSRAAACWIGSTPAAGRSRAPAPSRPRVSRRP